VPHLLVEGPGGLWGWLAAQSPPLTTQGRLAPAH